MGLDEVYNKLATSSQNAYDRFVTRNPLRYYLNYGKYLILAQGPKLSYINTFEPEYTKKSVKMNAPIVLGMFAVTFIAARLIKASRCKNKE